MFRPVMLIKPKYGQNSCTCLFNVHLMKVNFLVHPIERHDTSSAVSLGSSA